MNYFLKKTFNKITVYFFYLINNNSRQYFFTLIWRKIYGVFSRSGKLKYRNSFILKWCEKNKSFLPSQAYLDMVNSDKFNYNDPDLSLSEKYSLMAIKGGFKIV